MHLTSASRAKKMTNDVEQIELCHNEAIYVEYQTQDDWLVEPELVRERQSL
jgi:hypothetical protein